MAIQWLVDTGLLHKVYCVSKPSLPLAAYKELSAFKLYHNDTGLLCAMAQLNVKTVLDGDAVFTEFKGALTEQFVFQQLLPNEVLALYYYTFSNSKYEIDFIIQNENDEIIPIEVKSGENLKARSFKLYCDMYNPKVAIRSSIMNYQVENNLINVPLYCIGEYVK